MGVEILQKLLEEDAFPGCCVPINLSTHVRQDREFTVHQKITGLYPKYTLVVDGECCLSRLYGGYFSDWICGGQWNRMVQFVRALSDNLAKSDIEFIVFFNGGAEPTRFNEWVEKQRETSKNATQILKHVNLKGTPPPKAWWIPPTGLHYVLRVLLCYSNIRVVYTLEDHHQELMAYLRENSHDGILGDSAEYVVFDPPELISAKKLKLTYKGVLESKEYKINTLKEFLHLDGKKMCVLAALLGNHIVSNKELRNIYLSAGISSEVSTANHVKKLADHINSLDISVDDPYTAAIQLVKIADDPLVNKLANSIRYYLNGTEDIISQETNAGCSSAENNQYQNGVDSGAVPSGVSIQTDADLDTSKLATENAGQESFTMKTLGSDAGGMDSVSSQFSDFNMECSDSTTDDGGGDIDGTKSAAGNNNRSESTYSLPKVHAEVMKMVYERHSKGMMSPFIFQILSKGEIRLPALLEDFKEIPNIHAFYKPIRQKVYAILYNLNHQQFLAKKKQPGANVDIRVTEWSWSKRDNACTSEIVKAIPVGIGVSTVQRLWFGTHQEDKKKRLNAFLACMSANTSLMMRIEYVPQKCLIGAAVLKYILSHPEGKAVISKQDLDAFVTCMLHPDLSNVDYTQELQIPVLSSRGIQLATLFMQGVEMAVLVNDACGAPVPRLMFSPWLFFDGKLFQYFAYRSSFSKNLAEVCESNFEIVMAAERMKQAILQGIHPAFARAAPIHAPITTPAGQSSTYLDPRRIPLGGRPADLPPSPKRPTPSMRLSSRGRGRPLQGGMSRLSEQRAQLEIAGVVVGSWGPSGGTPGSFLNPPEYFGGTGYGMGRGVRRGGFTSGLHGLGSGIGRGSGRGSISKDKRRTKKRTRGGDSSFGSEVSGDAGSAGGKMAMGASNSVSGESTVNTVSTADGRNEQFDDAVKHDTNGDSFGQRNDAAGNPLFSGVENTGSNAATGATSTV